MRSGPLALAVDIAVIRGTAERAAVRFGQSINPSLLQMQALKRSLWFSRRL